MKSIKINDLAYKEALRLAEKYNIIDLDKISQSIEEMQRKEILENHPYTVWQNAEGLWLTYLPDEKKGRVFRKRRSKEEIENLIVDYYHQQKKKVYIKDVFKEWIEKKLKYGEIQPQSYDRYCTDFERFFPEKLSICKKCMQNITEEDLTEYIKTTIHEKHLTRKAYSGLSTLIRGIFKHGKAKGYTDISISHFLGDLEIPRNMFEKKLINIETEIFQEEEIPIIIGYLKSHVDIWNLALLLQFETGMRIGEVCALRIEDIHEDHIKVCRTEVKCKIEGKSKVFAKDLAKTDAGNRTLYFPETVKWTLAQIEKLNPHGEFLFMNKGKRIRENTLNKRLSTICEELRIAHRTTHKIRRTYGTTLLDCSVADSTVVEQMGHTDVSTTRKLYYYSNKSKETKIKQINNAINY